METMTLFASCSSKQSREVTWQEMYELIRGNALRAKTEALRQMTVGGGINLQVATAGTRTTRLLVLMTTI